MFRFGLPSFKLLIAGAVAAAAYAYHKGLFPETGKGDGVKRPAAAMRVPVPPKPVGPQRAAKPQPAKGLVGKTGGRKVEQASAPRPAKELPMPKPMLTGSVTKLAKPRPPEALPASAKK
jgi:hypothetical protein